MVEQDHYDDYYLMEVLLVVDHYQAIPAKHILCHKKHVMKCKRSKHNTTQKIQTMFVNCKCFECLAKILHQKIFFKSLG